jgi:hypothetical protein
MVQSRRGGSRGAVQPEKPGRSGQNREEALLAKQRNKRKKSGEKGRKTAESVPDNTSYCPLVCEISTKRTAEIWRFGEADEKKSLKSKALYAKIYPEKST